MTRRTAVPWGLFACVLSCALDARAGEARGDDDGSLGRFDGDLAVAASAGMTVGPRAPRVSGDVRLRYLSTAGVFGTYEDGPLVGASAEPRRVLALGVELRPLFLARWATGTELGLPRLDLLIDSLGLEVGAVFLEPEDGRFGARTGLAVGLGLELPLFARPSGPLLGVHGGARWCDAALAGGPLAGPSDRALYLTIALGWQELFGGGHVVDLGDRRATSGR